MRPEPSKPGRRLSFAGAYFSKVQRGYTTGPRSPRGPGGSSVGGGRWVWGLGVTLVLPEPTPSSYSQNEGVPVQAGVEPSAGTFLC